MEVTWLEIGTIRSRVHFLPAVAPYPVSSPIGISLDRLRSTWMASVATDADAKRHLLVTESSLRSLLRFIASRGGTVGRILQSQQ
jgi:hypothetical protein